KENERLKEQLAFSQSIEQKNYAAQIIGRDPDSLYSGLTINKGSRHGIRKNMPVIAVQNGTVGLVGKIVTVGLGTSLVMPVYDLKCSVSGRIQNTRDIGLVNGRGTAENPLSMKYIKKRVLEELHFGDLVVTSGESENYIRDIPIGSISKITVLDYDSSLDIEITPIIDFARLETVIVTDLKEINPNLIPGGTE
ncbi:MAG: rod shape-determining protein MreC, partial [Treponema sp.]|nr:rod shape-determining protein MreC [Treponema sp.]